MGDPIGLAGGINTYGYVGGDSINWVDPFGLETCIAIVVDQSNYAQCTDKVDEIFPTDLIEGDDVRCAGGDLSACARDQSMLRGGGYLVCLAAGISIMSCKDAHSSSNSSSAQQSPNTKEAPNDKKATSPNISSPPIPGSSSPNPTDQKTKQAFCLLNPSADMCQPKQCE